MVLYILLLCPGCFFLKLSDKVNGGIIYAAIKWETTNRFRGSVYGQYNSKYFFISILLSQLILFFKLIRLLGMCFWRYHRWCCSGTQPLVWSAYYFLSCTFYIVIKKKKCQRNLGKCLQLGAWSNILDTSKTLITYPVVANSWLIAPSICANDFQIWFSVHLLVYTFVIAHYCFLISSM